MTTADYIDEAIRALTTRVNWYRSHGGRSMKHGRAYKRNRRRAELALEFWRTVRASHALKAADERAQEDVVFGRGRRR